MPLEASGEEWFCFAYGDDWQRHAEFFAAGHAKVLVRDHPGLDPGLRERQAQRLAQVSAWAAAVGRSLIVELLVPATDVDKDATAGSTDRYDDELRPGHTLAVMEYLQDRGVEPAIWTVEGLDRHDNAVAVAAIAARAGRQARALRPDVILVDIGLGEESGFDLARLLAEDGRGGGAEVILISTGAEADYSELIDESPATGFLAKSTLSARGISRILGHTP